MISLFKKKSFKITAASLVVILAISGVWLINSKTNADVNSVDEQITANADTDEEAIVQEETEKDAASTNPDKDTAPVPVQEKAEKDTTSANKEDNNKQKIKEQTTTTNSNQATSSDSQAKENINNKSDDFSGIDAFWKSFRNAILSNNISEVKKMTRFPLSTRGPMDGDPIIKFSEDKFEKVFQTFLNKNNGLDGNTELSLIKNSENLSFMNSKDYNNSSDYAKRVRVENNSARIGDMCFELTNNQWKLTFIYLDSDNYDKIG